MAKRKSTKAKEVPNDHLYSGTSPSERARGRAAGRAAKDRSSQAGRVARDGVGSSAESRKSRAVNQVNKVKDREDKAAAREAKQKALAQRKAERLKRQDARQDGLYKRDPRLTAKDEKARRLREAAEKRRLEALEKQKLEAEEEEQKRQQRQQRQKGQDGQATDKQDHLYNDGGATTQAHRHASAVRESKYEPLYSESPSLPQSPSLQSLPPRSAPPVVTSSANIMHGACTAQAWGVLETQLALLS